MRMILDIGGSRGWRQGRAPPLGVQILSISCSFQQIIRKIMDFWELAPPPGENPGSATVRHQPVGVQPCSNPVDGYETRHSIGRYMF